MKQLVGCAKENVAETAFLASGEGVGAKGVSPILEGIIGGEIEWEGK